ncbi:MAG: nucleoside deaminase [Corallococcus sp.]|nr:nucleoside deaminase [Corallococcus sp.]
MTQKETYMLCALKQAEKAAAQDEVPIGAVIVKDGKIIARACNNRNKSRNAVCHAEVLAIQKACKKIGDWRLNDCEMYVTLEPCLMCAGACYNARLGKVYFGAYDTNGGGATSVVNETRNNTLNHNLQMEGGILQSRCAALLTDYFANKRKKTTE